MIAKRVVLVIALLTLVVSPLVFSSVAVAQSDASVAAEMCRALDESGDLEDLGITRGECVNILKGPSSEQANNRIAGLCGETGIQAFFGVTNKGQCIKAARALF
jgi:hypothetical protein